MIGPVALVTLATQLIAGTLCNDLEMRKWMERQIVLDEMCD